MNHNSVTEIRALLEHRGIALKKRFGQNFLIDASVRARIRALILAEMERAGPAATGEVWEFGPGLGALTDELLDAGLSLRLFEIDRGLVEFLQERYAGLVSIEHGDVVRFLSRLAGGRPELGPPVAIVGNLPYHSAGSIIGGIVEAGLAVRSMVFMVQTELAERLAAAVGTKSYGALSVVVQTQFEVVLHFSVPGGAFYPRPRVGSHTISLRRKADRPSPELARTAAALAHAAFAHRRKTLRNTLRDHLDHLARAGIDPSTRPEQLAPGRFVELAAHVSSGES